jgi:uncharacterized membrane-anchored protein YitT (DUF2179 family)
MNFYETIVNRIRKRTWILLGAMIFVFLFFVITTPEKIAFWGVVSIIIDISRILPFIIPVFILFQFDFIQDGINNINKKIKTRDSEKWIITDAQIMQIKTLPGYSFIVIQILVCDKTKYITSLVIKKPSWDMPEDLKGKLNKFIKVKTNPKNKFEIYIPSVEGIKIK